MFSLSLKFCSAVSYFVQSSKLVQGRGDGGLRLPCQADGLGLHGQAGGGGGHLLNAVMISELLVQHPMMVPICVKVGPEIFLYIFIYI